MSALAPTMQAFFTERLIGQRQASPHTIAAYRDTSACCSRSLSNAPASGRTASTSRISTPCWSPRFWITSSSSATAATPQDTERPAGGDPLALPLRRAAPPRARGHDRARARDPDQAPRPRDCQLPRRVGNRGAARCPRPSPLDRPARPRPDGPHHPDRAAGLRADHAALPRRAPRRRPPTSRPPARAASNASRRCHAHHRGAAPLDPRARRRARPAAVSDHPWTRAQPRWHRPGGQQARHDRQPELPDACHQDCHAARAPPHGGDAPPARGRRH
jgi:hypothetical protein